MMTDNFYRMHLTEKKRKFKEHLCFLLYFSRNFINVSIQFENENCESKHFNHN